MKRITVYHQINSILAKFIPTNTVMPLWENNLSSMGYVNGSGIVSCVGNAQSFNSYEDAKQHVDMMCDNGLIPNDLTVFDKDNVAKYETEYEIVQFEISLAF